jgi:hypothetical protein
MAEKHLKWRVHVPNFLNDIIPNLHRKSYEQILQSPMTIFKSILGELAELSNKIDDPRLHLMMCRMALYSCVDRSSSDYDKLEIAIKKMEEDKTMDQPKTKKCTVCKDVLPIDDFSVRTNASDGRQFTCRSCVSDHYNEFIKPHTKAAKANRIHTEVNWEVLSAVYVDPDFLEVLIGRANTNREKRLPVHMRMEGWGV